MSKFILLVLLLTGTVFSSVVCAHTQKELEEGFVLEIPLRGGDVVTERANYYANKTCREEGFASAYDVEVSWSWDEGALLYFYCQN